MALGAFPELRACEKNLVLKMIAFYESRTVRAFNGESEIDGLGCFAPDQLAHRPNQRIVTAICRTLTQHHVAQSRQSQPAPMIGVGLCAVAADHVAVCH